MVNEQALQAALRELESSESINYYRVALKHKVDRNTLARRHKGITVSNQEAHSIFQKLLTDSQEQELVRYLNELSDRGIPPTPQFVENLVREIIKAEVGQGWVRRFVHRYEDQIKSVYLRSIDQKRKIADNSSHFSHYFKRVNILSSS